MSSGKFIQTKHLIDDADPRSLALLSAMYASLTIGDLPPPVTARNLGLYRRWREWAEGKGGDIAQFANVVLSSPRARYAQCVDVLDALLKADSAWERIRQQHPTWNQTPSPFSAMSMAPLMFWALPHTLIEPTDGLEQLLANSDLGEEIPIDFLRPPASANYIHFGPALRQAVTPISEPNAEPILGAYVFECVRDLRALAIVPVYGQVGRRASMCYTIDFIINNQSSSLIEGIQGVCGGRPELTAHYQSIAQICTKVFLYFNLAQAERVDEYAYSDLALQLQRVGPKKAAKFRRHAERIYDRIVLGPQVIFNGPHGGLSPHWRRGHFRLQPHGTQNALRKVIFIAPVLVRADRLAAGAVNKSTTAKANHTSR